MPYRKYVPEIKAVAVKMALDGLPIPTINERLGVDISRQSFARWIQLFRVTHSVVVDPATYLRRGCSAILTQDERDFLLDMVNNQPTLYLDELKDKLAAMGIKVSESTVLRELRNRLGLTLKVARTVHPAQDIDDRTRYFMDVAKFPREFLVFTDESAISKEAQLRRNGWARKGQRTTRVAKERDGRRFSLLPAVAAEGVIAAMVQEGPIIRLDFEYFLEKHLLPVMNPYPGPLSVLICDNCKVHKGERIKNMCIERGIRLIYLPGYSPDLNPIEKSFGVLKSFLKRGGQLTGRASDVDLICKYCAQVMTRKLMTACFRNCGY